MEPNLSTENAVTLRARLQSVLVELGGALDQMENEQGQVDSVIKSEVNHAWESIDFVLSNLGCEANETSN